MCGQVFRFGALTNPNTHPKTRTRVVGVCGARRIKQLAQAGPELRMLGQQRLLRYGVVGGGAEGLWDEKARREGTEVVEGRLLERPRGVTLSLS
jgi:hypothetical protein